MYEVTSSTTCIRPLTVAAVAVMITALAVCSLLSVHQMGQVSARRGAPPPFKGQDIMIDSYKLKEAVMADLLLDEDDDEDDGEDDDDDDKDEYDEVEESDEYGDFGGLDDEDVMKHHMAYMAGQEGSDNIRDPYTHMFDGFGAADNDSEEWDEGEEGTLVEEGEDYAEEDELVEEEEDTQEYDNEDYIPEEEELEEEEEEEEEMSPVSPLVPVMDFEDEEESEDLFDADNFEADGEPYYDAAEHDDADDTTMFEDDEYSVVEDDEGQGLEDNEKTQGGMSAEVPKLVVQMDDSQ